MNYGQDCETAKQSVSWFWRLNHVHIYQTEKEFEAEDGDCDFLYGKDDKGYYSLQDGMILEITDGAVKAVRNG